MSLEGKGILVTGGASGIGAACALVLASRGAKIAVADIQPDKGEQVAARICAAGGTAFFSKVDLTVREEVKAAVKRTLSEYGSLDVLANAAGAAARKAFIDLDDDLWDRMLKTNLYGTFLANQEAIKVMVRQGGGRIINFGSLSGVLGRPELAAYSAAKAGVVALSRAIQNAHHADNIVVCVVAPGGVETPMWHESLAWRTSQPDNKSHQHERPLMFGRTIKPQEVAELVALLADDATGHMLAGQTLHVNGGSYMG